MNQPLFLRRTIIGSEMAPDDYIVVCGELTVARIMKVQKSFGRFTWDWSITGPVIPVEMSQKNGWADSPEEAKAMVRAIFDRWLNWVNVHRDQAVWHG